jgi:hypothetical protein
MRARDDGEEAASEAVAINQNVEREEHGAYEVSDSLGDS